MVFFDSEGAEAKEVNISALDEQGVRDLLAEHGIVPLEAPTV